MNRSSSGGGPRPIPSNAAVLPETGSIRLNNQSRFGASDEKSSEKRSSSILDALFPILGSAALEDLYLTTIILPASRDTCFSLGLCATPAAFLILLENGWNSSQQAFITILTLLAFGVGCAAHSFLLRKRKRSIKKGYVVELCLMFMVLSFNILLVHLFAGPGVGGEVPAITQVNLSTTDCTSEGLSPGVHLFGKTSLHTDLSNAAKSSAPLVCAADVLTACWAGEDNGDLVRSVYSDCVLTLMRCWLAGEAREYRIVVLWFGGLVLLKNMALRLFPYAFIVLLSTTFHALHTLNDRVPHLTAAASHTVVLAMRSRQFSAELI